LIEIDGAANDDVIEAVCKLDHVVQVKALSF